MPSFIAAPAAKSNADPRLHKYLAEFDARRRRAASCLAQEGQASRPDRRFVKRHHKASDGAAALHPRPGEGQASSPRTGTPAHADLQAAQASRPPALTRPLVARLSARPAGSADHPRLEHHPPSGAADGSQRHQRPLRRAGDGDRPADRLNQQQGVDQAGWYSSTSTRSRATRSTRRTGRRDEHGGQGAVGQLPRRSTRAT
jgi:hypothetical protein